MSPRFFTPERGAITSPLFHAGAGPLLSPRFFTPERGPFERIGVRARLSDVPFRLLGVVADPNQAADLTGHAFAHYAASGTDITLLCATGRDWYGAEQLPTVRRLGVRDLVLLDYDLGELAADALTDVFADVMACVRPHVVVADSQLPIREAVASAFSRVRRASGGSIREAVASAFSRVRRASGGSSALPAKLYYRLSGSSPLVSVTTAVAIAGESPETFVRAFPDPWVTGVLERDLFAGLRAETTSESVEQQLAG